MLLPASLGPREKYLRKIEYLGLGHGEKLSIEESLLLFGTEKFLHIVLKVRRKLRLQLKIMRSLGKAGHWAYDVNSHHLLVHMVAAETALARRLIALLRTKRAALKAREVA